MKLTTGIILGFLSASVVQANNSDLFNYGMSDKQENGANSYGQQNWDDVTCSNRDTCAGFPNKYPYFPGYSDLQKNGGNNCRWCPADKSKNCGLHRQSPIDLKRDRGVIGSPNEKECPDWHWMQYRPDTCKWEDMQDQFTIERHALQIHTPQLPNGDIDCFRWNKRRYPRIDYSKGFPDWWWMQRTDVMVPSQHTQEGTRYAAEITLAHFYEIEHVKNQLGHIAIFMQDYPDAESWPYLDKLICQWRKKEDEVRAACGKPPVEPYGRCALLRNQPPTDEWLEEAGLLSTGTDAPVVPTASPVTPTASPVTPTASPVSPTASPVTPAPSKILEIQSSPTGSPNTPTASPVAPTASPVTPTASPVTPTASPVTPTSSPVTPTASPVTPTASPVQETQEEVPPEMDCSKYGSKFMERVCTSTDPCCESVRSDTDFCWNVYDNIFPGEKIKSACYHCCADPKIVGEAKPIIPEIPKTMECSAVDNPFRMCKPGGCCSTPNSRSRYCRGVFSEYQGHMESICHYCCRESRDFMQRSLRVNGGTEVEEDTELGIEEEEDNLEIVEDDGSGFDIRSYDKDYVPEGAKVTYSGGQKHVLRPENFETDDEELDEAEYFKSMYSKFQERNLDTIVHEEDYTNLEWFPYEWLIKVGTEYYYRYEGTMLTPPCWEVVHWRAMKDPIRVHPRQIQELHRLLAWRLNPDSCDVDTAGVVSDDGNTVDLSRETMYYESPHRKVFCECKDWPSKFPGDQEWCRNWKQDTNYDRFYERPYSFDSGGKWNPNDP